MHLPHRVITALAALAAVTAAAALMVVAAGCGPGSGTKTTDEAAQARTLELATHEFSKAADALLEQDRTGFSASLPVDGSSASAVETRATLEAVYETLSPLPWESFSFEVEPLDPAAGLYRVRGVGQLGDSGLPDRIAVERELVLADVADGATIVSDRTPPALEARYLMALHEPVALERDGLVVLADGRNRRRALTVADGAVAARRRLLDLGVATGGDVLLIVYSSAGVAQDSLGMSVDPARLRFFAFAPDRVSSLVWPLDDVGVNAPWVDESGEDTEATLTHELAHAYTVQWFTGKPQSPSLLIEGIAEVASGDDTTYFLREEVGSGNGLWPLPESFAETDLWAGADGQAVRLGYEVGASLIGYVRDEWGPGKVKPFALAIAGSDLTEASLDARLKPVLGVGWERFYDGWRRYVLKTM